MNEQRDLRRELEAWAAWPEAWQPKEGEVLVGTVLRHSQGLSAFGPVDSRTSRKSHT